jgi:uncharacterized protein
MPDNRCFAPLDNQSRERKSIVLAIDEYEAIRLIDLEGLSQEECALRMNVARTTAQAIYNRARVKLAEFLVNGLELSISGGEYLLCGDERDGCRHGHCHCRRHMSENSNE